METVILVIHLLIAIALIATVLLQRSEGGALGIGGGGNQGFMSARGAANVLTRTTAVLAGAFFLTSIILTIIAKGDADAPSILDAAPDSGIEVPLAPVMPAEPMVPMGDDAQ